MNRPLTPPLSPSDGERVAEGRVRGGSWSQCVRESEWRLSMNRAGCGSQTRGPDRGLCEAQRFMVPMRAQKRKEANHEPGGARLRRALIFAPNAVAKRLQIIALNSNQKLTGLKRD